MRKEDAIDTLTWIEDSLRALRSEAQRLKTSNIYKKPIYTEAREICRKWFDELEPSLPKFGLAEDIIKRYHDFFGTLVQVSVKISVRTTYLKAIDNIISGLKNDLLVPVEISAGRVVSVSQLAKILEAASEDEKEYLEEALGCANQGYFRGSVVLGWCAAVHRMHKVVEKLGFEVFNKKVEEMRSIQEGRFKTFKKSFNIQSIGDLRKEVFDKDLLWVLDYWEVIDPNQHDRLSICLTMRNNSGHPGEAPITEENLASFYSDLKTMVFDNYKLKL